MGPSTTACPLCGGPSRLYMTLPHTRVFRCVGSECDLQFASPQLDDHDLAKAYAQLYYRPDGSQAVLENTPEPDVRHLFDRLSRHFGPTSGKRILDYGCGSGMLLRVANSLGARATGVEQDSTARAEVIMSGVATVYAGVDDLQRAEPGAQFDWVILCEVIEHLRRPWIDLEQLRPLVKPSGELIVLTPNFDALNSRLSPARWEQRTNLTHLYYFTPRSLSAVLKKAGFAPKQLPPIRWYSQHGFLRRQLQRVLSTTGLQGSLMFNGKSLSNAASAKV